MRQTTRWTTALGLIGAAWFASAQETPTPAPAPRPVETPRAADPAPTPQPAAPAAEVHELQIIEVPSTQDAPAPPDGPSERREIRIIDGDTAIWVDEGGEVHKLGDAMGLALEFNPEIRAIRAEIQALMARLEQIEMKTATDVVRKKEELKMLVDKQKDLKSKYVNSPELRMVEADIAAKKVEMDYMLGVRGDGPRREIRVLGDIPMLAPHAVRMGGARPAMDEAPENIRQTLNGEKVSMDFKEMDLENVVSLIGTRMGINAVLDTAVRGVKISVDLKDVTYGQVLLALSEANGLAFIVRDYGIFVSTRERAISIPGPSIPEGVPYSPRASATPMPALVMDRPRTPDFEVREHGFERRKDEHAEKILDYVEAKPAQPAPKPAPNNK